LVSEWNSDGTPGGNGKPLPTVFEAPIRPDVVQFVHTNIAKNHRQPYAVSEMTGHQTSAESWGTGRAVARIPRVPGGGTHRAGQGAYGNMCRGGRMFAPTQIWRRWHRKVNTTMKRHAVASALAASAVPSLVMARGHRIAKVAEIPLVINNKSFVGIQKTKKAVEILKKIHAYEDVAKVIRSKRKRAGKGKMRNRRYKMRKGPLIVYKDRSPMLYAFRNIPGIDFACVKRLNLLDLAPGGHVGRFIIWTSDAFEHLDELFGTYAKASKVKHGYHLPRPKMSNPDIGRILSSAAVKSSIARKRGNPRQHKKPVARNPLKHLSVMASLNPLAVEIRRKKLLSDAVAAKSRAWRRKLLAQKKARKQAILAGVPADKAPIVKHRKQLRDVRKKSREQSKKPETGAKPAEQKPKLDLKARRKLDRERKAKRSKRTMRNRFNAAHRKERAAFVRFLFEKEEVPKSERRGIAKKEELTKQQKWKLRVKGIKQAWALKAKKAAEKGIKIEKKPSKYSGPKKPLAKREKKLAPKPKKQ